MYCPHCGDKNPDDARFCGNCGKPLPAGASAGQTPPTRTASAAPARPVTSASALPAGDEVVSSEMKIGIAVASVILPVVGIVMGIIYIASSSASRKAAGRLWLIVGGAMTIFYCSLASLTAY